VPPSPCSSKSAVSWSPPHSSSSWANWVDGPGFVGQEARRGPFRDSPTEPLADVRHSRESQLRFRRSGRAPLRMLDQYLETDGTRWAHSCSTAGGVRLWPSHGAVVIAKQPPIDRYVLINGFDVWVEIGGQTIPLSTNRFAGNQYRAGLPQTHSPFPDPALAAMDL